MKAADTSAVIAAFASWHDSHEAARRMLDRGLELIGHCALETYSVLARLPPPHRARSELVRDFLAARFPQPFLCLTPQAYKDFILGLPDRDALGGAAYDALVAATAAASGAELVTCDRRALPVYQRYAIPTHFVG